MSKTADQTFYDGALNVIRNGATRASMCTNQPTVYAATYPTQLAQATGLTSGTFTLAAGDATPTGRKLTVAAINGLATTAAGTGNWMVLDDGAKILYVTSTVPASVVFPGTANFGSWKIEIPGPT
jgi:hypothetical protein